MTPALAKKVPLYSWRENSISMFVLGTVQMGLDYGIANTQGKPTLEEAIKMVRYARKSGINCFDTAQIYGISESVLGEALSTTGGCSDVKLVSKFSPDLHAAGTNEIVKSVKCSCRNLKVPYIWAMLLHRPEGLDYWDGGFGRSLVQAKEEHLIKYIGVSVYSVKEAERALKHPEIDIVQVPYNAWDQKMETSGVFELAGRLDKLCFIRSIFLQGLLTMPCEDVEIKLPEAKQASQQWKQLAGELGISGTQLGFRCALSLNMPLVIGAEKLSQLRENVRLFNESSLSADRLAHIRNKMKPFINDEIINPLRWNPV